MGQLWPDLRYYLSISVEGLRKIRNTINQDGQSPSGGLNLEPIRCKAGVLNIPTEHYIGCVVTKQYYN